MPRAQWISQSSQTWLLSFLVNIKTRKIAKSFQTKQVRQIWFSKETRPQRPPADKALFTRATPPQIKVLPQITSNQSQVLVLELLRETIIHRVCTTPIEAADRDSMSQRLAQEHLMEDRACRRSNIERDTRLQIPIWNPLRATSKWIRVKSIIQLFWKIQADRVKSNSNRQATNHPSNSYLNLKTQC